jgi:GTP-binding protein
MKIKRADYAGTVHDAREHAPEVAFAGRSNAGKSSLINALLGRKNLVQTSKVPGKTRNINYFIVETVEMPPIYMVDMPGYGYARIAKGMKSEWDGLARRYFTGNTSLKLLVIVWISEGYRGRGKDVIDIASRMGVGVLIAATKADKVNMSERNRLIAALKASSTAKIIAVSSVDRSGIDKVWQIVESSIGAPGDMS